MKKLVVLSGAGMSAESGISTFRDAGGLWEGHDVYEVASPMGWEKNPELVLDFYNQRRKQLFEVEPNQGHVDLAALEKDYEVWIVTQNIDDLHERAGSTRVLHLHGELKKARSTGDESLIYDLKHWELKWGDVCEKGYQLRPHIVWFGEAVPMIDKAMMLAQMADIFVVIGTSMQVYPAAGLINYALPHIPKFYIDPKAEPLPYIENLNIIPEKAGIGVKKLRDLMD